MKQTFLFRFNIIAGICSIASLLLLLFGHKTSAYIALGLFVLFLLSVILLLVYWIYQFVKKEYPEDYTRISAFSTYETTDGVKGIYERYRIIQSKRLVMTSTWFQFKWSGSKIPKLSSNLQTIEGSPVDGGKDYDKIKLVFKEPLRFNDTATIHFRAEVDDVDGAAGPYDCYKVETPIQLIHFRITLKHKPSDFNKPAKLQRCLINSPMHTNFETIEDVPFDKNSKSYQYDVNHPEVGYFYRILWDK